MGKDYFWFSTLNECHALNLKNATFDKLLKAKLLNFVLIHKTLFSLWYPFAQVRKYGSLSCWGSLVLCVSTVHLCRWLPESICGESLCCLWLFMRLCKHLLFVIGFLINSFLKYPIIL